MPASRSSVRKLSNCMVFVCSSRMFRPIVCNIWSYQSGVHASIGQSISAGRQACQGCKHKVRDEALAQIEEECGRSTRLSQTSYLSLISQIISVEKYLSCGEISDFCKEFEHLMEFYRNLCRFCSKFVWRKICVEKISVEKKWQMWGLILVNNLGF